MAIFFALDAYPTFALWTRWGAAIVWVGLRQRRLLARLFGIALQFAGAWLFLFHYVGLFTRTIRGLTTSCSAAP